MHNGTEGVQLDQRPGLDPFILKLPDESDRLVVRGTGTLHVNEGSSVRFTASGQWFDGATLSVDMCFVARETGAAS